MGMELKGSNNWSDVDSEESEPRAAKETPVEKTPKSPERKPPLFNVIYSRDPEMSPTIQQPVFQERDRNAPEVGMGVTLGMPEFAGVAVPGLPQLEQERLQQTGVAPEVIPETSEDDEDDEADDANEGRATSKQSSTRPVQATPLMAHVDQQSIIPSQAEQLAPYSAEEVYSEPAEQTAEHPVPYNASEYQPPVRQHEDAWAQSAAQPQPAEYTPPAPGGGNTPPVPPEHIRFQQPEPEGWGGGPNQVQSQYAYNTYQSPPNTAEYVTRRSFENAQQEMRRKMAARMIVAALLGWYLGRRPVKQLREQTGKLQEAHKAQTEQLSRAAYEQQQMQARISEQNRQIEQFTRPQSVPFKPPERTPVAPQTQVAEMIASAQPAEQQKIIAESGEEIVLQPGQRLVREGPYSFVVNEHNQIVHNVIPYGDEYKRDLLRERPPTPFGTQDARFGSGSGAAGASQPTASSSGGPMLPGVQIPADHPLSAHVPGQAYNPETQRLLNTPKSNPVVTALTSPWLWLGVGVLLIAFFAAATI